jgi:lysozyme family protein
MPDFSELKSEYATLWASMNIRADKRDAVGRTAKTLIGRKSQYVAVSKQTGVPWFVIAALHNRESDANFSTYLGNGEPLDRVTRLVPKGRGPFETWEAGAIDALSLDGLDRVNEWTPERACFEIEKFNGFGYRNRGVNSPYLWSFSNHYARGKYVADGRFSASHVDQQCGAIPILKRIMELDETARFPWSKLPIKEPVITTGIGATIATYAHQIGASPKLIIAILIVTAIAAGVAYAIARARA